MSCSGLKAGLPELVNNIDAIKYEKPGTVRYDLALYVIKRAMTKAAECI